MSSKRDSTPARNLPGSAPILFSRRSSRVQTVSLAIVELLELIAVRSVDGVGEVGEQDEAVVERVRIGLEAPFAQRLCDLEVQ